MKSIIIPIFLTLLFALEASADVRPKLHVEKAWRECNGVADCKLIYTDCGGCDCGTAINKKFIQSATDAIKAICVNYDQEYCEVTCTHNKLACINKKCVTLEGADGKVE